MEANKYSEGLNKARIRKEYAKEAVATRKKRIKLLTAELATLESEHAHAVAMYDDARRLFDNEKIRLRRLAKLRSMRAPRFKLRCGN